MPKHPTLPSRRLFIGSGLVTLGAAAARAASAPTPSQTTGPYYPETLPLDADNDLVRVAGQTAQAAGEVLHLFGRVTRTDGNPVAAAQVEIWQCDAAGRYHHPRDPRGGAKADPSFQGFGATVTASDGAYRFRTIVPVPYPGRTPHIHVLVRPPSGAQLVTQLYLDGHPRNARDVLYRRLAADAQARLSIRLEGADRIEAGAKRGHFEIVLA